MTKTRQQTTTLLGCKVHVRSHGVEPSAGTGTRGPAHMASSKLHSKDLIPLLGLCLREAGSADPKSLRT